MFKLYKYKTPKRYSADFRNTYSYINVRQVKILSSVLLGISSVIRIIYFFYNEELIKLSGFSEYDINNIIQISCSFIFLLLSHFALKNRKWTQAQRELLAIFFVLFILTFTFNISYIYAMHNTKNTLVVFLIGITIVSIFFALEFKQIIVVSAFVVLLFLIGIIIPSLSIQQKLLNIITSGILAFVLYTCSRYGYYFKSQHFIQVKQLEEKNAEVQELNRQKNDILGFVAHDLRNPLNNIEALSILILEDSKEQENKEIELILMAARQGKYIINDLIEIAQEEKKSFHVQETDLVSYIGEVCTNWQTNLDKARKINLKTIEQELIASINPSGFTRVMDNLIGNGLKFSDPETPIDIEILKIKDLCQIKVTDFGIGIPSQLHDMLFNQFSKAGRPGLKGEKSIGLGLHISKRIIAQHGGSLMVESKENEGSTFIISLPLT